MPVDANLAGKTWARYAWARDNGHHDFVLKADKCDRFVRGDQWQAADLQDLKRRRIPAITVNKMLSTLANVQGEQIKNRTEISYRPMGRSSRGTADVLTRVFKHVSQNNQLDWLRSDMFSDGIIRSRGFLDVRLDYNDHAQGEVRITKLNSKNVVIDPDAEDYDPDTWSDVMITKWLTADDIAVLYNKEDAEYLKGRDHSSFMYGADSIQTFRDRFGGSQTMMHIGAYSQLGALRNMRVIDRQHRELDRQQHFLSVEGDMRQIPADFDRNRIAWFVEKFGFKVVPRLVRRIRWTVICDNVVLHDDWSPYKHFTVIPYFPHFMHGYTVGLAENLLGPQEVLNKVTSQELHVINTTANSGYIVKSGSLVGMTAEELEQKGAQTGVVIEVNDDVTKAIQKIQPNQVPTGLDRVSFKAEEHIKTISGVSDSMQGFDREDVAAKAIQAKRQAGSTNLVKPLDNLARTDFILARNVLDLVQTAYTDERVLTITRDELTGETETFTINEVSPEGRVVNDLTLGEYSVSVSLVPVRDALEDSQFEQAVALREMGVMIPDSALIEASRLMNKKEIIRQMQGDKDSPEAKAQAELQRRGQEAEVSKLEGEAASKHADAGLKQAKAQKEAVLAQKEAATPPEVSDPGSPALDAAIAEHEASLKEREFERDTRLAYMELGLEREKQATDAQIKAADLAEKREDRRVEQERAAAQAALRPKMQGAPQ